MPLYGTAREKERLQRAVSAAATIDVKAFHPANHVVYDRGAFRVLRCTTTSVFMEKVWAAKSKERDTASAKTKSVPAPVPVVTTSTTYTPPATPVAPPPPVSNDNEEAYFFKPGELFYSRASTSTATTATRPLRSNSGSVYSSSMKNVQTKPLTATLFETRTFARPALLAPPQPRAGETDSVNSDASSGGSSGRGGWNRGIPRAIKTVFNGIEYRSRLESNFARLLTALGIRFVYEPIKFNQAANDVRAKGSTYMIDFFLPAQQLYVELKPKRPHIEEEAKCEEMSKSGFRVALMYGSSPFKLPYRSEYYKGRPHRDYAHHDALRGMTWIDGVKLPGDTVFVHGNNAAHPSPLDAGACVHLGQVHSTQDQRWSHDAIVTPIKALQYSN
jgi:hypothetical protein